MNAQRTEANKTTLRLESLTQRKFQQIERVRGSKTEMKAFSISFYIMCQFSSLVNASSADVKD